MSACFTCAGIPIYRQPRSEQAIPIPDFDGQCVREGLTAIGSRDIVNRRMAIDKTTTPDPVCCPPAEPQPQTNFQGLEGPDADDELAKLAKAIGHPARVRILRMLSRKEARVCSQIVDELPLAQSTVSEHLRILKDAGLVRSSQDGPRIGYCINYETLRKLKALVAII